MTFILPLEYNVFANLARVRDTLRETTLYFQGLSECSISVLNKKKQNSNNLLNTALVLVPGHIR